jgi:hypothetical protein
MSMTENEVREAYEQLVGAFREGRDKFGSFADDATIIDGGRWFGSLAEYRTAWEEWVAEHGPVVPDSVETRILDLRVLGDTAVLIHSIESGSTPHPPSRWNTRSRRSCSAARPTVGGW